MLKWTNQAAVLFVVIASGFLLIYLEALFKPIVFGALFALMLLPLLHRLLDWGLPRWIALSGTLVIAGGVFYLILFLFARQFQSIGNEIPALIPTLDNKLDVLQNNIKEYSGLSPEDQFLFIKTKAKEWAGNSNQLTSQLLAAAGGIASLLLAFVFMFLFLLYKSGFRKFFHLMSESGEDKSSSILDGIRNMMKNYFRGLATVMTIVGILNSIGLWLIGLNHPVLFGMLSALLGVIPYVGIASAGALAMSYAWISMENPWAPLFVFIIFYSVQTLEGNILTPLITGGKTRINPLATLIALLTGLSIWGIAGMIIAIPTLATFRIIAEHIPEWKAFAYLVGEGLSEEVPPIKKTKKKRSKHA